MKIVQTTCVAKSNNTINNVVKNTSCSRGWLRLVVQLTFGIITVTSFILIVHMAMQRPKMPFVESRRCSVANCRVHCTSVNFVENDEEDVIATVLETGLNCAQIILSLRNATFENETLPFNWMSRMPSNIQILKILGGNLRHIPSTAFLGQFAGNVKYLGIGDVTISKWLPDTFVGLSSLKVLFFKNCEFGHIERHALMAIDDSLHSITVTHSGEWNPAYITGPSNNLHIVDFSFNFFGKMIKGDTFMGLKSTKILYLNSCKITSIANGAFDSLINIELLFLNDNLLTTIPSGLFRTILTIEFPKPRIHLQDNLWKCDCLQTDLIDLFKNELLPLDPVCKRPADMVGKTIGELEMSCRNSPRGMEIVMLREKNLLLQHEAAFTYLDTSCYFGNKPSFNSSLRVVSPVAHFNCRNISFIKHFGATYPSAFENSKTNWLKPSFLIQNSKYSVMQVGSSAWRDNGLLWYQSSCPNEVYCLNTIPSILRVYNSYPDTEYTFCPIDLATVTVALDDCVKYNLTSPAKTQSIYYKYLSSPPFLYIVISFICLGLGAMCVYLIIRKNPSLLRGSKRLLFVKHRNVDALVLPPKIPFRSKNSLTKDDIFASDDKIYTVPDESKLFVDHFVRSNSVRSDKSSTPTYISAMQPTEAQLAEWRIRHHFDKSSSIISISSDISTFSWTSDCTSAEITTNVVYESLK